RCQCPWEVSVPSHAPTGRRKSRPCGGLHARERNRGARGAGGLQGEFRPIPCHSPENAHTGVVPRRHFGYAGLHHPAAAPTGGRGPGGFAGAPPPWPRREDAMPSKQMSFGNLGAASWGRFSLVGAVVAIVGGG